MLITNLRLFKRAILTSRSIYLFFSLFTSIKKLSLIYLLKKIPVLIIIKAYVILNLLTI